MFDYEPAFECVLRGGINLDSSSSGSLEQAGSQARRFHVRQPAARHHFPERV